MTDFKKGDIVQHRNGGTGEVLSLDDVTLTYMRRKSLSWTSTRPIGEFRLIKARGNDQ